jgi:hypothetical protein
MAQLEEPVLPASAPEVEIVAMRFELLLGVMPGPAAELAELAELASIVRRA